MCCKGLTVLAAGLAWWLTLGGCARKPPAFARLAVLPFENLTAEGELEWARRGLAEAMGLHLAGSAQVHVFAAGNLNEAIGARATHVLHGYLERHGGRLRAAAVLEELSARRTVKQAATAGPAQEGLLPLARALAVGLEGRARPFGVSREAALRAYVEGLTAAEATAAAAALRQAVEAEPDFGAAYLVWAQRLVSAGDLRGARQVLAQAGARAERIGEPERARLALLAAALEGDRGAERRALSALAQAAPADADVLRRLGELELALRRPAEAVEAYRKAAARDPDNGLLLNQLGYAQAYTRDLEGAVKSLRRYQELHPYDPNPLDSLGDVHYYLGRFAEAEQYYQQAWQKDAAFLGGAEPYKVAWARLMRGDRSRADEAFGRYLEVRRASGDPAAELRRAEWEYLTGRRQEAMARLEGLAKGPLAARAWSQLAIWSLHAGQRERARSYAARAAALVRGSRGALLARLCQFMAEPEADAAAWAARAERAFPAATEAPVRRSALAHALLLAGHLAAATPLLKQLYEQTPPSSAEPINVLLAWALIETGGAREAAGLLETYAAPEPAADQPFYCLSFPRLFRLRAIVLAQQGRQEEARAAQRLFEALGGETRS